MSNTIDNNALFKISYGLFCLTAADSVKNNGCIVNTVIQVTQNPLKIAVCVNKANYTHDLIMNSGVFNVSASVFLRAGLPISLTASILGLFRKITFLISQNLQMLFTALLLPKRLTAARTQCLLLR